MSFLHRFASAVTTAYLTLASIVAVQGAPLDPNAFTSLGTLDISAGTLTINTDTLAISGAAAFTGVATTQSGGPEIAVFAFDYIDVDAVVTVTFSGSRPVALLSHGNATILATLTINGGDGGAFFNGSAVAGAAGPAGGASGGSGGTSGTLPSGPGAGIFGGGGGFGGEGGDRGGSSPNGGGPIYGDVANVLQGGSGGGGVLSPQNPGGGGGGGAGAIEIGALDNVSLGALIARGGRCGSNGNALDGGGGSGGAVVLHGASVSLNSAIDIRGGLGGNASSLGRGGGGGGGGRALITLGAPFVLGASNPAVNTAGGAGGLSQGSDPTHGYAGGVGVADLLPALTVIPSGQARQLNGVGEFSEVLSGGSTLRATNLQVNAGAVASSAVPISTTHDLVLNGGFAAAALGWTMTGAAQISGFGQVSGAVAGSATNYIDASGGVLTLGDANSTAGFSVAGDVDIASGATLNLLDADAADLGAETTLAGGARLNSLNGVELGPGEIVKVSAPAEIGGRFTNQGTVNGPATAGEFLTFTDDVDGPGNYTGNVLFSDGFSPGASPAQVSFEHVAFDATAELSIELGGTTPGGQFDQLNVAGEATLGGQLTVSLIDGYSPSIGQSFTILTADDVDGEFTIDPISPLPGLIFDVIYNPTSVVLTVSPAFTADFDEDGDVDAADLAQWQGDFGVNGLSDADNDGDSDGDDFLQWQRQLGSTTPATPANGAVPEPASAALLSAAFFSVLARVRRLRR